ncbi:hypothetical protein HDU84_006027, partial [Entophlyctis sp. JEL0112]
HAFAHLPPPPQFPFQLPALLLQPAPPFSPSAPAPTPAAPGTRPVRRRADATTTTTVFAPIQQQRQQKQLPQQQQQLQEQLLQQQTAILATPIWMRDARDLGSFGGASPPRRRRRGGLRGGCPCARCGGRGGAICDGEYRYDEDDYDDDDDDDDDDNDARRISICMPGDRSGVFMDIDSVGGRRPWRRRRRGRRRNNAGGDNDYGDYNYDDDNEDDDEDDGADCARDDASSRIPVLRERLAAGRDRNRNARDSTLAGSTGAVSRRHPPPLRAAGKLCYGGDQGRARETQVHVKLSFA